MAERTALVVGASRGLGLGLVRDLAGRGWSVIATLRSEGSGEALRALAGGSGGKVRIEMCDVEDGASIDALAGRLKDVTLDLLFVNAGITLRGLAKAGDASRDDVARIFLTNTVGPIHVAEAFLDQMRDGPGVIAMMTSGLGSISRSFRGGSADLYSASKAALNKLTRSFTLALGDRKLTVLSISPGWVRTDMGGPGAMLSVEDSVKGIVDVVEAKAGTGEHGFYGHDGATVPW
ncbi:MAG TPA: SDR family oxidoreductase [Caulobacteraceae bacterium]|nr:SDR family oxidoreductase [Caulobacteraceae bacterium]